MLADAYEQAASQVSNPYLTDVNTASAQTAEEALFRRIFSIADDTELTSDQQLALTQFRNNGVINTTKLDDGTYTASLNQEQLATAQQTNNDILTQKQEELTNAQNVIEAYSQLEQYQEQYEDFQNGDRTAFQEQLITQYTTMEELQDLYEEGYVDAEH